MGVRSFLEVIRAAFDYIEPDPEAIKLVGENSPRHSTYPKRIVLAGGIGAAFGFQTAFLVVIFNAMTDPKATDEIKDIKMFLILPIIGLCMGIFLGFAITCLFAPTEFLTGPVGLKWMRLIGTENVAVGRLVYF